MVYFDNAATTFPKPAQVRTAIDTYLTSYGANPGRGGHEMSMATDRQIFAVREQAAAFFGAESPEQVVFTKNCTEALNIALQGFLCPGDHVVISDVEHNSVLRPICVMAKEGRITYSIAVTVPRNDNATVEHFRRCIRPNTRLVVCTHSSNVFGTILPIRKIGKLCRERGILFFVDAAQTAGVVPISLTEDGIHCICTAGHKSLYGPTGTGLLITSIGSQIRPLMSGGSGSNSRLTEMPQHLPDRLEAGTINTCGILGLGAGLDFVQRRTVARIAAEEMAVLQTIYASLHRCKAVKLYTPFPTLGAQTAVLSFNVGNLPSEKTAALLNQQGFAVRGGLQCAPLAHQKYGTLETGTVRVSVGAFNTPAQGRAFAKEVLAIARGENNGD